MAAALFIAGLAAAAAGLYGLAGPWWTLLAVGLTLAVLGVLTERGAPRPVPDDGGSR